VTGNQPYEVAAERLREVDDGVDADRSPARPAFDGAHRAPRVTGAEPEIVLGHSAGLANDANPGRDHAGEFRVAGRLVPDSFPGFKILTECE